MKVILDTNVVLDVLFDRRPFAEAAAGIFSLAERSRINGMLCAATITTVHYLLGRVFSREEARQLLSKLLSLSDIAAVNRHVVERDLGSTIRDFEDAVLSEAECLAGAEYVLTRNARGFMNSPLRVFDPAEFLPALGKWSVHPGI